MTTISIKERTIQEVLGTVFRLYVQSHCYHWNVVGPNFRGLHAMFESQYQTLNGYMDAVAERLRVLGVKAPASFDALLGLSSVTALSPPTTADDMLAQQCTDFVNLIDDLRAALRILSDVRDDASVGVLTDILAWSEKEHWMMSAALE